MSNRQTRADITTSYAKLNTFGFQKANPVSKRNSGGYKGQVRKIVMSEFWKSGVSCVEKSGYESRNAANVDKRGLQKAAHELGINAKDFKRVTYNTYHNGKDWTLQIVRSDAV